METLLIRFRRVWLIAAHLVLAAAANQLAFLLRFEGDVPPAMAAMQVQCLPWLLAIRGLLFAPFGLYRGLWRYAGIWDLRNILVSVALGTAAFYVGTRHIAGLEYPRSILVIDALVSAALICGLRLVVRLHRGSTRAIAKRDKPAPAA